MAEICFQRAPGQDLGQKGRFQMVPEGDFNCRPSGLQMAEICFQRAPGQDLAPKGRFPMVTEEKFNSLPRGCQMVEMCMYVSMCACILDRPPPCVCPIWDPGNVVVLV